MIGTFRKMIRRSGGGGSSGRRGTTPRKLNADLNRLLEEIRQESGGSVDVIIRPLELPVPNGTFKAAIVFLDGMADTKTIMDSLLVDGRENGAYDRLGNRGDPEDRADALEIIKHNVLKIGDIREVSDFEALYNAVLSGDTVILLDGYVAGIAASMRNMKDRGVSEPSSQTVIRGPKEGFSETLRTNTVLIRRKIKDPNLWLETMQIGSVTRTEVAIMYIKGIAHKKVVDEVRARLEKIEIDAVLESGYIEEMIQDKTFTPFPTMFNTERPDVAAAGLVDGRVVILVDGTPFVLIVPALFTHFLQAPEDYYQRYDISTLLRILRYLCLFIAILGPSAYIAVTTFHQEMIPTPLLISVAAQREGIPFPAFVEALLMEITFEILREAGVRMPRAIGQSVSIVGALVVGQSAVDAGLVSPAMVIVVAITAIANFVIPSFNMGITVRMLRFPLMVLAATFGLFGILVGVIAMVLHMCSLRSFGVPYLSPFAPISVEAQKDNVIRVPHRMLHKRPQLSGRRGNRRNQDGE